MTEVTSFIVDFLRAAWGALALALVAFSALAMLAQVLRTVSAGALGASLWVWEAIAALIGILVLAAFGIWGVPAIIAAGMAALPGVLAYNNASSRVLLTSNIQQIHFLGNRQEEKILTIAAISSSDSTARSFSLAFGHPYFIAVSME